MPGDDAADRLCFLRRPSREAVLRRLEASAFEAPTVSAEGGFDSASLPGFVHDTYSIPLGAGDEAWARAREALRTWRMFEQAPLELVGGDAPPEPGRCVAVLMPMLGLWWMSLSRVAALVDERTDELDRYGFVYVTLEQHALRGRERFEVRLTRETGEVLFRIDALSRPSRWFLWPGYPLIRRVQRRFGRGALEAMTRAVGA